MKKTTTFKGHRWTDDELTALMGMWADGRSPFHIAKTLGVTPKAVDKMVVRLRQNGIPLQRRTKGHVAGRSNKPWTQSEVEHLMRRRKERATMDEIASDMGRTHHAINAMITKLRREGVPIMMFGQGVRRLWNRDSLIAVFNGDETDGLRSDLTPEERDK